MGEVDGEGMERRPTGPETGVGSSETELADPEEADETDAERALPLAAVMGIVMGSVCLTPTVLLLSLVFILEIPCMLQRKS